MLRAQHSIFIVGWDIDSRTRLVGESGRVDDGLPVTLVEFLRALVERRPALTIHLLLWNYSVVYAPEREFFPTFALDWNTPKQVHFCLDDKMPLGSSHHQKIIMVDDAIAFSGGLDLTIRRWDTSDHAIDNPARVDPSGKPYRPFHDVQAAVDGDAARALGELVRDRWRLAAYADPAELRIGDDVWPVSVKPDFRDVDIGIARTLPATDDAEEIREVETLFLDSIDAAEHTIYVENQFVTSQAIAERLSARLQEKQALEAVIVVPRDHDSWLEAHTMRNGRIRFLQTLRRSGAAERVRVLYPHVADGAQTTSTMIHSKVMAVDDRLLRIGSANMNNRSMGADTECDLVIEAKNAAERKAIANIRNRLLAEHCGAKASDVEAALAQTPSLIAVAETLSHKGHSLKVIDDGELDPEEFAVYVEEIADPPYPLRPKSMLRRWSDRLAWIRSRQFTKIGVGLLLIAALTLAWRYTPLRDLADTDTLRGALVSFKSEPWSGALVVAIFLGGGLIVFPLLILIAATMAVFGPWYGFAYAATGALGSALLTYAIGAWIGKAALRELLGARLDRIRNRVQRQGVLAVATIRLVPIAPFTLVNLVAGASEIKLLDYVLGTFLGLLPGMIVMAALGQQIFVIFASPSIGELLLLGAILILWIGISLAVQAAVARFGGATS